MKSDVETKLVSELKGTKFHIPTYQRGYRWTESEVEALLNDIKDFDDSQGKKYCLQPLIVQKKTDNTGDTYYEVIDGQQRLTTIFIIFLYLKTFLPKIEFPFEIKYETRPNSKSFLEGLSDKTDEDSQENIDYYHMKKARQCVDSWFDAHAEDTNEQIALAMELMPRLNNNTMFIWYDIPDSVADPIKLFISENAGKIPLTSAELIKATLLNRDNFSDTNEAENRQDEMAIQWDSIEKELQKDSFWHFLNNDNNTATRIGMLFDILAQEYNKELGEERIHDREEENEYFSYLVLDKCISPENRKEMVRKIWKDVDTLFEEFKGWYEDVGKHNLIGYLIAKDSSEGRYAKVQEIRKLLKDKRKSDAMTSLRGDARKTIPDNDEIGKLDYNNDKPKIGKVLLLFNIATLNGLSRFPFDKHKRQQWDIEHIHSVSDKLPDKTENAIAYLKSLEEHLSHNGDDRQLEAKAKIEVFLARQQEDNLSYGAICNFYAELLEGYSDIDDLREDNSIDNLALLDASTNRSYQNATFFSKRKTIIKREKDGTFVPICTKNVFLKLYSDDAKDLYRWNKEDRTKYVGTIVEYLEDFLAGGR